MCVPSVTPEIMRENEKKGIKKKGKDKREDSLSGQWVAPETDAPSAGWVVLLTAVTERVHWVHSVSPSLLFCGGVIDSTAASTQHRLHLTAAFTGIGGEKKTALLTLSPKYILWVWVPAEHVATEGVFCIYFFTGDGRLVQCYQSGQVPLPTGGLPWSKWWGGEELFTMFEHHRILQIIQLL